MTEELLLVTALFPVALFSLLLLLALFLVFAFRSKSHGYRRVMTDMYIVGKIKQFATADKIDLYVEMRDWAKFMKVSKIDEESLDKTIERELQEKIADSTTKKVVN